MRFRVEPSGQDGGMTFRYDFAPTPFGDALAVFSDEGIVRFDLSESEDPRVPWLLEGVSHQLRAVPEPDPGAADELAHLLSDYFDGEPVRFDRHIRLDWRLVDGFALAALQTICSIEWGQTMSYGEVAILAGHPGAARAVGTACRITPSRSSCRCIGWCAPTAAQGSTERTPSASGSCSTSRRTEVGRPRRGPGE